MPATTARLTALAYVNVRRDPIESPVFAEFGPVHSTSVVTAPLTRSTRAWVSAAVYVQFALGPSPTLLAPTGASSSLPGW